MVRHGAAGRDGARRAIASLVLTGCRGPDAVTPAVRKPGTHTLTVRYGDGLARTSTVDLTHSRHVTLTAARRGGGPR